MKPVNFKEKTVTLFKNRPEGEQALVREFFSNKLDGFYVDVGANHPTHESQTYHLEQLGWTGLMLEPLPEFVTMLNKQRQGKVIQVACSSPENHQKKLKLLVAGGHSTLNSTPIAVGTESTEYIEVECKTLDSVLEENNVPTNFDFISIDIEGHEMEMFKGFSLERWKPRLILIEDHVTNHLKHNHLTTHGYQILLRTGLNSWYIRREENFKLSWLANLQFFRKYWLAILPRKLRYSR